MTDAKEIAKLRAELERLGKLVTQPWSRDGTVLHVANVRNIATFEYMNDAALAATYRNNHAAILEALRLAEGMGEIEGAMEAALDEMCRTVAPRSSFTDAVDRLDAALSAIQQARSET